MSEIELPKTPVEVSAEAWFRYRVVAETRCMAAFCSLAPVATCSMVAAISPNAVTRVPAACDISPASCETCREVS